MHKYCGNEKASLAQIIKVLFPNAKEYGFSSKILVTGMSQEQ
ncbi:hypothetical protein N9954_04975 [Maribacter sp.]|nr:hypothetical protein [Maribacter sp.]